MSYPLEATTPFGDLVTVEIGPGPAAPQVTAIRFVGADFPGEDTEPCHSIEFDVRVPVGYFAATGLMMIEVDLSMEFDGVTRYARGRETAARSAAGTGATVTVATEAWRSTRPGNGFAQFTFRS